MRKIILQDWLSLDGYAAGENNNLDFFTADAELNKYSDDDLLKWMEGIDTILLGRTTYELFVEFWPTATTDMEVIADKLNSTPKIIVSNTLTKASWGKWPDARIINGDVMEEIRKLKAGPGKDIVLWGSITLANSLMKENLIDEYHLRICPIVLGSGKKLFSKTAGHVKLKLGNFKRYESGLVLLEYVLS